MSKKRKDGKGKVLQKGEVQRSDGTYMYRWTDISKKRKTIYAKTLDELRHKELEITKSEIFSGISYEKSKITVEELMNMYTEIRDVKISTRKKYDFFMTILEKINILNVPIKEITVSIAKRYIKEINLIGYHYGTVQGIKGFLFSAFQMAVEDDYLVKNPFIFNIKGMIKDDREERTCISREEENQYLEFIKSDGRFRKCYEDIIILLHTGLRVSELYGLTWKDIDMKNRRININKQLHYIDHKYIISTPKSKAGNRILAMDDIVYQAFKKKISEDRPKIEQIVDNYAGFIFINHHGRIKTRKNLQVSMINIRNKYKRLGLGEFSHITPHVLRHTFCSRMIEKGMNVKTLQLVMGHSDIGTTLNVYTHKTPEDVAKEMDNIVNM